MKRNAQVYFYISRRILLSGFYSIRSKPTTENTPNNIRFTVSLNYIVPGKVSNNTGD